MNFKLRNKLQLFQLEPASKLATCLLAGSSWNYFFDPEDGGDMFLRKSAATQQTTRRHIPEDDTFHNHRCENLKSYNKCVVY
jgi:hypothetical protein